MKVDEDTHMKMFSSLYIMKEHSRDRIWQRHHSFSSFSQEPLEPPWQGGSNEYLQPMFWAEI